MTSPALSLAEIDRAWDDEVSGVRARPQVRPAGPPPLPLAVVARRYIEALDAAARARAELAERMGPGDRIEVGDRVVTFVRRGCGATRWWGAPGCGSSGGGPDGAGGAAGAGLGDRLGRGGEEAEAMNQVTEQQILHVLQHALGRDRYGKSPRGGDYRNHFCAGEGSADFATCREAVAQGLMVERPPSALSGGDHVFAVTDAGKAYVAAHSPPEPKLTRGQRRYRDWLAADCGLTFGEWPRAERRCL